MKDQEKQDKEYRDCVYYCYGNYCNRTYAKEKKQLGYSDLTEYSCTKKCYLFRKRNWWNKFVVWFLSL